jgi:hypothetical protein
MLPLYPILTLRACRAQASSHLVSEAPFFEGTRQRRFADLVSVQEAMFADILSAGAVRSGREASGGRQDRLADPSRSVAVFTACQARQDADTGRKLARAFSAGAVEAVRSLRVDGRQTKLAGSTAAIGGSRRRSREPVANWSLLQPQPAGLMP